MLPAVNDGESRGPGRFMRSAILLIAFALSMALVACPKAKPPTGPYSFTPPPSEWTPLKGEDGTLLFERKHPPMGITVYTTCDRYRNAPLMPLARNLFIMFEEKTIVEKGDATVAGREAFYVVADCKLEGTALKVKAYVFKANNCVYDLAYYARPGDFDEGLGVFENFVQDFRPQ